MRRVSVLRVHVLCVLLLGYTCVHCVYVCCVVCCVLSLLLQDDHPLFWSEERLIWLQGSPMQDILRSRQTQVSQGPANVPLYVVLACVVVCIFVCLYVCMCVSVCVCFTGRYSTEEVTASSGSKVRCLCVCTTEQVQEDYETLEIVGANDLPTAKHWADTHKVEDICTIQAHLDT
jgi:hypothetical protein